MTEIIKSNNNMAFDLLEIGGGSSSTSEGKLFKSLFGDIDNDSISAVNASETNRDQEVNTYGSLQQIIDTLEGGELHLSQEIMGQVKTQLAKLFIKLRSNMVSLESASADPINSNGNENFLHLMNFLEEIRGLIIAKHPGKEISEQLDAILDKIRTQLNEQIKSLFGGRLNYVKNKGVAEFKSQELANDFSGGKKISVGANKIASSPGNSQELISTPVKAPVFSSLSNKNINAQSDKKTISTPKSLNKVENLENEPDPFLKVKAKTSESKDEFSNQSFIKNSIGKDSNTESNLIRQSVILNTKLEPASNLEGTNNQRPSVLGQESNEKLINNLNMLSKSWGNKLIEKIEKSLIDGIEKLEISLTPKSLGRLNITINVQDTIAKINIFAENPTAAILLGEAETKLGQMMESAGLKLASLETNTHQFGQNQKDKEQAHKLASSSKKGSIDERNADEKKIGEIESKPEGLNLIA